MSLAKAAIRRRHAITMVTDHLIQEHVTNEPWAAMGAAKLQDDLLYLKMGHGHRHLPKDTKNPQ